MLAETDWVPVLTQLGAFVVILGGVIVGIMKAFGDLKREMAANRETMEETKKAVDGSISAWKADRKQAEDDKLKIVELAARAAGEKAAKDTAAATAAEVREAVAAQNKARADAATLARPAPAPPSPGVSAADTGVPLKDLRVTEKPGE